MRMWNFLRPSYPAPKNHCGLDYWPEWLVGKVCGRAYLYGSVSGLSVGIVLGILLCKLLRG
jgi:hypothetical protein